MNLIRLQFWLYFVLALIFTSINTQGQSLPSRNLFNISFENDFNNNVTGTYQLSDFMSDWRLPNGSVIDGSVNILDEGESGHLKYMRGYFPSGTYLPSDTHGFLWMSHLPEQSDELYFSYDVRFKAGFQWVLSGKLPGLTGGTIVTATIPSYSDGFSARMVWQENGQLAIYVYHQNQPSIYGSVFIFPNFKFETGKWYNLTMRVVLNTIVNGVAQSNGILEGFVDGKLFFQKSDLKYRSVSSVRIDNMYICSFFGGNTPNFAAARDEWLDTDNYLLFTYSSLLTSVPRGNQLSQPGRVLVHPYLPVSDAVWKKSLKYTGVSLNSVDLSWDEFPVPANYILERQEGGAGNFITVATLEYGTTRYSDTGLKTGTTYSYRVKAGNSVTDLLQVTTRHPVYPNTPGNLVITESTKYTLGLSWVDYSTNETGFKLERSLSASGPFQEAANLNANTSSYKDQSLTPGTTYFYRLKAYNQDGQSSYTSVLQASTLALQPPPVPGGVIISELKYTSAKIQWNDNSNMETGFELERKGMGENEKSLTFFIPANTTYYYDTGLIMKGRYQYRIRSMNEDGYSAWSNFVEIVTPFVNPPEGPTELKSIKFTDRSISVSWKDNSDNEDAFILTRALAIDSGNYVSISIDANDTIFTDSSLTSATTYQYKIKAINLGGSSCESNKNIATTLSKNELKRVKEGLVAYYNFGYNPDYVIYDQSGFENPLNLFVLNRSSVNWLDGSNLSLLSNSALVSATPAKKIVRAIKETGAMTVECWIKPSVPEQGVESRIISLGNNDNDIGFLLDQNYYENQDEQLLKYSIRLQTGSTLPSGHPVYTSEQTQHFLNREHIIYTRDQFGNEDLYINGRRSKSGYRPSMIDSWDENYLLRFGNESDMQHLWKGSYYLVAIYNKALSATEVLKNYHAGPTNSIDNEMSFQLEMFPNPANDYISVTITPENTSDEVPQTSIRLVDSFGKVLYNKFIFNPNYQFNTVIELGNCAPGIYMLQVISGNKSVSKKLVIR